MMGRFCDTGLAGKVIRAAGAAACSLAIVLALPPASAFAFDVPADEKAKLEACELAMCELFVNGAAAPGDVNCNVTKTWAGDKIKKGAEAKSLDWSLGDARCNITMTFKKDDVVKALKEAEFELKFAEQKVACELESEDKSVSTATMTLAPVMKFKAGKVEEASLGVGNIEAPTLVKGAIWTVAQLEETFGLFHDDMVKDINEFIFEKCPAKLKK